MGYYVVKQVGFIACKGRIRALSSRLRLPTQAQMVRSAGSFPYSVLCSVKTALRGDPDPSTGEVFAFRGFTRRHAKKKKKKPVQDPPPGEDFDTYS